MKKVFLWLIIVSMIAVFSLAGCKAEAAEEVTEEEAVEVVEEEAKEVAGEEEIVEETTVKGKIAFLSDRDGNGEIYIMNIDGSDQVNLTNNPANDGVPSFSPDGSKIVFMSDRDGNWEIYIMNIDGSEQVRLTNNPANDELPSFSPDGSKIVFMSDRDGNWEIYIMNIDGSEQVRLTNNPAIDGEPSFSPIPETTAEAAGTDTTTDTTISAEELTRANEAFASGAVVYLYDPQPATVSKSDLDATEFSLRYILSKDAKAVTTLIYILKVDAEGVNEPVFGDGNMDDWISETGKITFKIMSNPLQDVYDQVFKDEGITIQHVNDPVYLDILLLSPEEQNGSLLVSDSSKQLSNIVRIPVSQ